MAKERIFHLGDKDVLVPVYLDKRSGKHLYDYPIYSLEPTYTGAGYLCVNAFQEACVHIKPKDGITVKNKDCGCCVYYQVEQEKDLIGVCMCNENNLNKKGENVNEEKT